MNYDDNFGFDNFNHVKSMFEFKNPIFLESNSNFENHHPIIPFFLNNDEKEDILNKEETNSNFSDTFLDEESIINFSDTFFNSSDKVVVDKNTPLFYFPQPPGIVYNEDVFKLFVKLFFKYFPQCKVLYKTEGRCFFEKPDCLKSYLKIHVSEDDFNYFNFSRKLKFNNYIDFESFYSFLREVYYSKTSFRIKKYIVQIIPRLGKVLTENDILCKIWNRNSETVYLVNLYFHNERDIRVLCSLENFEVLNYISYSFVFKNPPRIKWILGGKKIDLKRKVMFVLLKIK